MQHGVVRLSHSAPHAKDVRETTQHAPPTIVEIVDPDAVWATAEVREPGIRITNDHYLNTRISTKAVANVSTAGPAAPYGVEQAVVGRVAVEPAQALEQPERPARDRRIENGRPHNRFNRHRRVFIPSTDNVGDHGPAFAVSDEVDRSAIGAERCNVGAERVGCIVGGCALGGFDRIVRRPGPPIVEDPNIIAINADAFREIVEPSRITPVAGNVDEQRIL
ncbi:MAG: hypothetical protein KJN73_06300 [Acidimicrobiia bacterium]|nr:hypothetical protein [Acidimicrobiia bacterium]